MQTGQLEAWVLRLVDLVGEGRKVEDDRVELKAEWPVPEKAARRLAGHANACRAESVLWIIGLDEKRGVVNATDAELADWFPQVKSRFDGVVPSLQHILVPTQSGNVIALLFDATRAPFVVKSENPGVIDREVPWREGTRIRSAFREDLLRLLAPLSAKPNVEFLNFSGFVRVIPSIDNSATPWEGPTISEDMHNWHASITLYVTPADDRQLVFPVHTSVLRLIADDGTVIAGDVTFSVPYVNRHSASNHQFDSHTCKVTKREAIFSGPGSCLVHIDSIIPIKTFTTDGITVELSLRAAGSDAVVNTVVQARSVMPSADLLRQWEWRL